ncbi:MAG: hypothetical protein JWQ49_11 [Edaphobacter sp.]|nr:hypothetical protein [Edaphobacter sp.]
MTTPQFAFAVESGKETIQELLDDRSVAECQVSVRNRGSSVDALNSPIGAPELVLGLQTAIIVFKTGAAVAAFATALVSLAIKLKQLIDVLDPKTGEKIATVSQNTDPNALKKLLGVAE